MDYAQAVAKVLSNRILESRTTTARATVTAVTAEGFVTFTDALGQTRKGIWLSQSPAVGDVITYLDEGRGIPYVLGHAGQRAWTNATLAGSWANYGGSFQVAGYRQVGDIVYLRGLVKDGALGTIFTLPTGFRPTADLLFVTETFSGVGRVDVYSNGQVVHINGSNSYVSLSPIQFSTS